MYTGEAERERVRAEDKIKEESFPKFSNHALFIFFSTANYF